jgi:hypothetical protein
MVALSDVQRVGYRLPAAGRPIDGPLTFPE